MRFIRGHNRVLGKPHNLDSHTADAPGERSIEDARAYLQGREIYASRLPLWKAWAARQLEQHGQEPLSFATLMLLYRLRVGMSGCALAKEIPLDPSSLHRYEREERSAGRETIIRIASVLRLSPAERDRLLVSSGFIPCALERVGWPAALAKLVALLDHEYVGMEDWDAISWDIEDVYREWLKPVLLQTGGA